MSRKIIKISKGTELVIMPPEALMYVSSDGNYSTMFFTDNRKRLVSMQLGQIEDAIDMQLEEDSMVFFRLGRKLIVNMNYIHFIDISRQVLVLSDFKGSYHELTASKEVLMKLKAYIETV